VKQNFYYDERFEDAPEGPKRRRELFQAVVAKDGKRDCLQDGPRFLRDSTGFPSSKVSLCGIVIKR
jgi:hypothetical protein